MYPFKIKSGPFIYGDRGPGPRVESVVVRVNTATKAVTVVRREEARAAGYYAIEDRGAAGRAPAILVKQPKEDDVEFAIRCASPWFVLRRRDDDTSSVIHVRIQGILADAQDHLPQWFIEQHAHAALASVTGKPELPVDPTKPEPEADE